METTGMAGAASEGAGKLRLMRLLEDLVRERGRMEAAKVLGVNYKTSSGPSIREGSTPG